MVRNYCRNCAIQLGYIDCLNTQNNFSGSVGSYLFGKFIKHTQANQYTNGIVSIFDRSDYDNYKNYIIDSYSSGSVEVDARNRVNIIWFANKPTGYTLNNGQTSHINDGVKLVLHNDANKIHAYPTGSFGFLHGNCSNCGQPVVT